MIAALAVLYALLAKPLARLNVTAPMVFMVVGAVIFAAVPGLTVDNEAVHLLAEVTLWSSCSTTPRLCGFRRCEVTREFRSGCLRSSSPGAQSDFALVGWLLPALGAAGALPLQVRSSLRTPGWARATILNPLVLPAFADR